MTRATTTRRPRAAVLTAAAAAALLARIPGTTVTRLAQGDHQRGKAVLYRVSHDGITMDLGPIRIRHLVRCLIVEGAAA